MSRSLACLLTLLLLIPALFAQESTKTSDWPPKIARKLPPVAPLPPGPDRDRAVAAYQAIRGDAAGPSVPDVEILAKAIDYALRNDEFFNGAQDLKRVDAIVQLKTGCVESRRCFA